MGGWGVFSIHKGPQINFCLVNRPCILLLKAIRFGTKMQEPMFWCIRKENDHKNICVHHCKIFPNPLNFVMISGPNYLRLFQKKPTALMSLSPGDVMDPIWEDYADGGRDELRVSWRKKRINSDKLWEEWRGIWLHSNLFVLATMIWTDKLFLYKCWDLWSQEQTKVFKKKQNEQRTSDRMQEVRCVTAFGVRTINSRHFVSCVPLVIVLEWE